MNKYLKNIDLSVLNWDELKKENDDSYHRVIWPKIFDTKDLSDRCDAALCADGLMAWGNCCAGLGVHPNFGEVMVMIGERLGISATGENLAKWADEYLKK